MMTAKDLLQRLRGHIEVLQAIETLEYHDKNHLYFGTDPSKLTREKLDLFRLAIGAITLLEEETK
jgi:hypothetical protein